MSAVFIPGETFAVCLTVRIPLFTLLLLWLIWSFHWAVSWPLSDLDADVSWISGSLVLTGHTEGQKESERIWEDLNGLRSADDWASWLSSPFCPLCSLSPLFILLAVRWRRPVSEEGKALVFFSELNRDSSMDNKAPGGVGCCSSVLVPQLWRTNTQAVPALADPASVQLHLWRWGFHLRLEAEMDSRM